MPNFMIQMLDALSSLQSGKTVDSTGSSSSSGSSALETADFATVMNRLNFTVNNAAANGQISLTSPYSFSLYNSSSQNSIALNLNSILKEIKQNNNSSILGFEGEIKQYLLKYYGGSKSAVIKRLSGVDTLPSQMLISQDVIFNQIVSKLAIQARESSYRNYGMNGLTDIIADSDSETSEEQTITDEGNTTNVDLYWI